MGTLRLMVQMPRSEKDPAKFLLAVSQSMNAVGYSNPQLVEFLKFLLDGRQIRGSYLSAETPPGAVAVALDITVLCFTPGLKPSLISVTARRTGVVEWSLTSLAHCASVTVSSAGSVYVATLSFGATGTVQLAAPSNEGGELNEFALEVARNAGY